MRKVLISLFLALMTTFNYFPIHIGEAAELEIITLTDAQVKGFITLMSASNQVTRELVQELGKEEFARHYSDEAALKGALLDRIDPAVFSETGLSVDEVDKIGKNIVIASSAISDILDGHRKMIARCDDSLKTQLPPEKENEIMKLKEKLGGEIKFLESIPQSNIDLAEKYKGELGPLFEENREILMDVFGNQGINP